LKYNPALVTYMEGLIDKAIKSNIKYIRWQKKYLITLN
jgi:hypothetical protein